MSDKLRLLAAIGVMILCAGIFIRIFTTEQDYSQADRTIQFNTELSEISIFPEMITTTATEITTKITETKEIKETETVFESSECADTVIVEFPIELNTATFEEFMALPGIGETIAGNIIAYREANGGFYNRQELLNISGIGEAKFQLIYDLVYIYNESEYIEEEEEEIIPTEEDTYFEEVIPILDVNVATVEDFAKLPGVDMELGERIVAFREEIGGFVNTLELCYVDGMTDSLYVSIRQYLMCETT